MSDAELEALCQESALTYEADENEDAFSRCLLTLARRVREAAADQREAEIRQMFAGEYFRGRHEGTLEMRERAATLVENHGHSNGRIRASHRHLAAAIRALSEEEK